ncbi:hypothetical protein, partial [Chloroflexus sp.]|uniref:hypothetical protein n=1 Tax=Chloroflexus sp. TaxID=1904827 RepID=UPI002ACD6B9C
PGYALPRQDAAERYEPSHTWPGYALPRQDAAERYELSHTWPGYALPRRVQGRTEPMRADVVDSFAMGWCTLTSCPSPRREGWTEHLIRRPVL